uniref:Uncharacterized protein n=1 Tax=Arundo donax TaxID=35708 RepID=A0A0A9FDV3_ARUDO
MASLMHLQVLLTYRAQICQKKLMVLLEQTPQHLLVGALRMGVLTVVV